MAYHGPGPKVPQRLPDEDFNDWIDRVNKGSSDGSGWVLLLIVAILLVGFALAKHL
jgi:hypothetical protein